MLWGFLENHVYMRNWWFLTRNIYFFFQVVRLLSSVAAVALKGSATVLLFPMFWWSHLHVLDVKTFPKHVMPNEIVQAMQKYPYYSNKLGFNTTVATMTVKPHFSNPVSCGAIIYLE